MTQQFPIKKQLQQFLYNSSYINFHFYLTKRRGEQQCSSFLIPQQLIYDEKGGCHNSLSTATAAAIF